MTSEKADQPLMETTLRPGQTVSGKYCVDHLLAAGGMATVWAGSNLITGKRVALKVILRSLAAAPGAVELFRREALAASRVNHPNVVTIFDVVDHATKPCIVMELLDGEDLGAYLARRGRLPLEEAAALLLPVMRGVASANKQGVVHRDLKPKNIFLCIGSDGLVLTTKVLDFGISVFADRATQQATQTVQLVTHGTPAYMSPEHITGSPNIDERADVYGFGVILFEALAGRPPYVGPAGPELLMRILEEPIPDLTAFRPDLSPEVDAVVRRAIAKSADHRYRNLDDFVAALEDSVLPSSPMLRALTPMAGVPRIDSAIEVKEIVPPVVQDARQPDLSGEHPGGVTEALLYVLSQSDAEKRALTPVAPPPAALAPVEPAPITLGPVPPAAVALASAPEPPLSRTLTPISYGQPRTRSPSPRPVEVESGFKPRRAEGDTARVVIRRRNAPWRAVIIPSIVGAVSAATAWFVLPNPSQKRQPEPTIAATTSQPVATAPPLQLSPTAPPLQPAATAPPLQPAATAPPLQPAATAPPLQPAATAPPLQPAATAPPLQPTVIAPSANDTPSARVDNVPVVVPSIPAEQRARKEMDLRGPASRQFRHEVRKRSFGRWLDQDSTSPLEPPPPDPPGASNHRAGQLSTDDF